MYPTNQFQYIQAIRENRSLSSNAKIVALIIASHYNWSSDGQAFPSVDLLALETGISRASVYRAKLELVNNGWLESERRFNNSNLYSLKIGNSNTDSVTQRLSHNDTRVVSQGDVQRSHSEALTDKVTDNLIDNISSEAAGVSEVANQEELPLDNVVNISKYLDSNLSLDKIKEEVSDKDTYFLILKERKAVGIL
jgi:DNA-binding transcriptional MocR family regulator